MKKTIAILLLLCLSSQYFVQTGFVSWFQFNKEIIVNVFCINKDKPEMHCEGQCFLNKQLKAIDHEKQSKQEQQKAEQHVFLQPNPLAQIVPIQALIGEKSIFKNAFYQFKPLLALLRPPQL